ncbi:hypothetical protein [Alloprevotella tannerae]|uniref:hypothetical protein n=1 Tax=Alloprevotella tannerae TaxID=76122 RepID=UPI0028D71CE3|nr:hypothetical protein [Alloprevotella tannerae]
MSKVVRRQFNLCTRRCCFFSLPAQDVSRNFNFLHGFIAQSDAYAALSFSTIAFYSPTLAFPLPTGGGVKAEG